MAHIETADLRRMFEVEDAHWWFDGMEAITARLLDHRLPPGPRRAPGGGPPRVLDAGCGTGRNLRFLSTHFGTDRVWGLDFSAFALGCCAQRGFNGRLARGSVNLLPFADAAFDLVTSFDVLVTGGVDVPAALREFARVLRPGGAVLLRVAAYDWLRGRHDREWAVAHRFRREEVRQRLAAAGLEVIHASYANAALFPVALLKRGLERLRPPASASDLTLGAGRESLAARVLRRTLAAEAPWVAGPGLPWGLSLFALATRPTMPPTHRAGAAPPGAHAV